MGDTMSIEATDALPLEDDTSIEGLIPMWGDLGTYSTNSLLVSLFPTWGQTNSSKGGVLITSVNGYTPVNKKEGPSRRPKKQPHYIQGYSMPLGLTIWLFRSQLSILCVQFSQNFIKKPSFKFIALRDQHHYSIG